jgi:hypothetical protein
MVRESCVVNVLAALVVALLLAGCAISGGENKPEASLPVAVDATPLEGTAENCAGTFVGHVLDHTTMSMA